MLDIAENSEQMDISGLFLHELKGTREGVWSVRIGGNWRITFRFHGADVELVNYEDYH